MYDVWCMELWDSWHRRHSDPPSPRFIGTSRAQSFWPSQVQSFWKGFVRQSRIKTLRCWIFGNQNQLWSLGLWCRCQRFVCRLAGDWHCYAAWLWSQGWCWMRRARAARDRRNIPKHRQDPLNVVFCRFFLQMCGVVDVGWRTMKQQAWESLIPTAGPRSGLRPKSWRSVPCPMAPSGFGRRCIFSAPSWQCSWTTLPQL